MSYPARSPKESETTTPLWLYHFPPRMKIAPPPAPLVSISANGTSPKGSPRLTTTRSAAPRSSVNVPNRPKPTIAKSVSVGATSPAEPTAARLIRPVEAYSVALCKLMSPPISESVCPSGTRRKLPLMVIGAGDALRKPNAATGATVNTLWAGLRASNRPPSLSRK